MKNKNKVIGLVIGAVCLILCLVLLLTRCGGTGNEDTQTEPSASETEETAVETTEATEETTEETEETTEATEATEETEEPTEEATEETTGGSSSVGGTGGFTGGTILGGDEEEDPSEDETVAIAAPGTETNAYTEYIYGLPDAISSVSIPTDSTIYYNIYDANDTQLVIRDPDAYVVYGGVTYTANENGILSVALSAGEGQPASLQLGNLSGEEKAYELNFAPLEGTAGNPEVIYSLSEITLTQSAEDADGYYYSWSPSVDGKLTLTLLSIDPEDAQCQITVNNGWESLSFTEGSLTVDVVGNSDVIIHVLTAPAQVPEDSENTGDTEGSEDTESAEGTEDSGSAEAPADGDASQTGEITVVLSGVFEAGLGTSENPYQQIVYEIPGSFETVEIGAGKLVYYDVYYVSGTDLTIEDPSAYVVYNGEVYTPDENGVITLTVKSENPRYPVSIAIGNTGEAASVYTVGVTHVLGSDGNPQIIEETGDVTVSIPEGCDTGYCLSWTAVDDGILTVTAAAEGVEFDVIVTNTNGYAMAWLSEGDPITMEVARDDVVMLQVAILPDENWNYPAADVTLTVDFEAYPGTQTNPYTAYVTELPGTVETVEIRAGELVYYDIYYVSDTNLTVTADDITILYNGNTYTPDANGQITIPVKSSGTNTFVSVQVGNTGEEARVYTLSFIPNTGTINNPEEVYNLTTLDTWISSGNEGYYYTYTAIGDGAVSFWVDEEDSTDNISYDIILTLAHYDSETDSYTYTYRYLSEGEYGTVSTLVAEGDVVTIEVTASQTATVAVRGTVYTGEGTSSSPFMTTVTVIPEGYATVDVVNGSEYAYSIYRVGGAILTVTGTDAYVIYEGTTYKAVDGVVTVQLGNPRAGYPVSFTVGNTLTAAERRRGETDSVEGYVMWFEYPVGTYSNPEVLTDISSFTAKLEAGNGLGYYYTWTAPAAGTVTFEITDITSGVTGALAITQSDSAVQTVLEGEGTVTIEVNAGTEVSIIVSTMPDDSFNYPAAAITVTAVYEPEEAPVEETAEEEPVTQEPSAEEPAEEAAAEEEPVTQEPSTEEPETEGASAEASAEGEPAAEESPAEEEPAGSEPTEEAQTE